ncbi:MAG: hypothetical protein EBR38_04295 [Flavobacteriaceae bacterium]|nr:hypothetical protein [Flavobacteriaceae bacterium]
MFLPSPKSILSTNNCGIINFPFLILHWVSACRQSCCVVVVIANNPMKNQTFLLYLPRAKKTKRGAWAPLFY